MNLIFITVAIPAPRTLNTQDMPLISSMQLLYGTILYQYTVMLIAMEANVNFCMLFTIIPQIATTGTADRTY